MGGSALGNAASRRATLAAQRRSLTAGADRGAPQAPTRTQPQSPPLSPQQPETAPQQGDQAVGGDVPTDEEALEQVAEFLQERGAQVQGQGAAPRRTIEGVDMRPGAEGPLLNERIRQLGVVNRPPETQFFRIAGREPTPRELSLFNARLTLEKQLKRPPTADEMRASIVRAGSIAPLFSPAVERSGAGVAGPPPGA